MSGIPTTTDAASHASVSSTFNQKPRFSNKEINQMSGSAKMAVGASLTALVGTGFACKDGINKGFERIGRLGKFISSIFAIPATLLIPLTTAYGEYEEFRVKNPTEQSSSKLLEIIYPILSIAFAPMTAFEPIEKATQSKGHMITTLLNMPHIAFTFFTYTGGRFLTLIKSLQLLSPNLSEEKKLRLENERKLMRTLGDIGSDNAAVTPEAHQAATGWITWGNILSGDFASVKERLSEAPVTTILGTFIGSIFWIPTFIGKSFDTVIRTLEMTDQLKNTMPETSLLFKNAVAAKDWWHKTSASNSIFGKILCSGREFGKIMQAVASPVGMVSVVFPVFDHFFRHGFNNKEAEEAGGFVKGFDKILNIGAFFGHLYFTTLYGLFIRLPQTVVTTTFYGCNIINRMRGVLDNPNDPRYIDPRKIRDRMFDPNKGWAKTISDFAGNIIEKCTGKNFLYDNIYKVVADEECFRPIRESLYKQVFDSSQLKIIDNSTGEKKLITKDAKKEPAPKIWGEILRFKRSDILTEARKRFETYLKEASMLNQNQVNDFFNTYKVYDKIEIELKQLIDAEIDTCLDNIQPNGTAKNGKLKFEKPKMKSESFIDMLKHPIKYKDDIKEVFKFRTSIAQLVMSPLNILDFVNIVEMGDKGGPYWLSNWLVQESSIRIGDYKAGNIGELMTVYCHAVQTAGKGAAHIKQAAEKLLRLAA